MNCSCNKIFTKCILFSNNPTLCLVGCFSFFFFFALFGRVGANIKAGNNKTATQNRRGSSLKQQTNKQLKKERKKKKSPTTMTVLRWFIMCVEKQLPSIHFNTDFYCTSWNLPLRLNGPKQASVNLMTQHNHEQEMSESPSGLKDVLIQTLNHKEANLARQLCWLKLRRKSSSPYTQLQKYPVQFRNVFLKNH